jgi:hypothetical protein
MREKSFGANSFHGIPVGALKILALLLGASTSKK